jgi:UDP-hydrolysing UDP-N-acetyl-D-glucosamine 2-epimerase
LGENPKYVFQSGSPGIDEVVSNKITSKKDLEKKFNIRFTGSEILLVYHPDTTQAEMSGIQINKILNAISNLKKPTIALGPNSDAGSKEILDNLLKFSRQNQYFQFYKNLRRSDYLGLLNNIGVLVGNSSSGIIEASYFAIPVVNIGIRQKGREKGKNVIDVSDEKSNLIQNAILNALKRKKKGNLSKIRIYGNGNASKKIVSILEKIKLDKKLIQKQIFY